jgi:hypothetical protein
MHNRCCAVLLSLVAVTAAARQVPVKRQAVRQVDRILIESTDPRSLYDLFTGPLQLPVSWPLSANASYASGGFGTGNLNIEVFRSAPAKSASPRAQFAGIAFEPYSSFPEVLPELKTRGVSFGPPEPYISTLPDKTQGTVWTTVVLDALASPGMRVFLFQYSPAFLNVHVRRNQLAGQLVLRKGGPLGVVSAAEIVIGTPNLQAEVARWQNLLPAASSPGFWKVGNGPALRMVADTRSRIQRLVFAVASLPQAETYLRGAKILGSVARNEVSINPERVQGLSIGLRAEK